VFVDWIAVSQYHGERAREWVGSLKFSGLTGRLGETDPGEICESAGPRALTGSYDTTLNIKSHNGWVTVKGNPSRFNRPDNLFGYELDEGMFLINEQLGRLGLPVFQPGEEMKPTAKEIEQGKLPAWTGAAFMRLDLTENYSAGSELHARLAIRSYQARAKAYAKKGTWGEETAMFYNSHTAVKGYRKGPDMKIHCPESEWTEWADQTGIVRHELELKSRFLSKTGYRYWGNCTMGTLHQLFEKGTEVLRRPDASLDPMAIECCPAKSRAMYALWLRGEDVRSLVSRATLYRHRKVLMETASIDIAEPRRTGEVLPIVRIIDLAPCRAPAGYWDRRVA
jgi:II/X family phage/plasmid replication protein